MYQPSEDTLLLAESVREYEGKLALEIGVGSGEVSRVLCQKFSCVIGTDIDFASLKFCRGNLPGKVALVCCDSASSLRARFDLIVSNPPYLPLENGEEQDKTIHGGVRGNVTTLHFLDSAKSLLDENGKMIILSSSLSNHQDLLSGLHLLGLKSRVLRSRRLFFETLFILEITLKFDPLNGVSCCF